MITGLYKIGPFYYLRYYLWRIDSADLQLTPNFLLAADGFIFAENGSGADNKVYVEGGTGRHEADG